MLQNASKCFNIFPGPLGGPKPTKINPLGARRSQGEPRGARKSQEEPAGASRSQEELGETSRSQQEQEKPAGARS